eukprot:m.34277 g.34277  ORF g.34277 m.34277 type:complete len:620 (-) comp9754_c0_seq2:319-2178(-)
MYEDVFLMLLGIPGDCFLLRAAERVPESAEARGSDHQEGEVGSGKEQFYLAHGLPNLQPSDHEILSRLCVLGSAFRNLEQFIDSHLSVHSHGIYIAAFVDALDNVLDTYRSLVNELHLEFSTSEAKPFTVLLHLLTDQFQLLPALQELQQLVSLPEVRGCQILDVLQRNVDRGAEVVSAAFASILESCFHVFLAQLTNWVVYGSLDATNSNEFLVKRTAHAADAEPHQEYHKLWDDFALNPVTALTCIEPRVARMILDLGRHTLIVRTSASRGEPGLFTADDERMCTAHIMNLATMGRCDSIQIERALQLIQPIVSKHLWEIVRQSADLPQTLQNMHAAFFLHRGDLFTAFLEHSADTFASTASRVTTPDYQAMFELASADLGLDSSQLTQLFTLTTDAPRIGQEANLLSCLHMEANVQWPLDIIFTPPILKRYDAMFQMLFKIRYVEHQLNGLWKHQKANINRLAWALRSQMSFIVHNFESYLQGDILTVQCASLLENISKAETVHDLIAVHEQHLTCMEVMTFLHSSKITEIIHGLLDMCLKLCKLVNTAKARGQQAPHKEVQRIGQEFVRATKFLFQVLSSTKDRHHAQLALRLDFNKHFTKQIKSRPSTFVPSRS